ALARRGSTGTSSSRWSRGNCGRSWPGPVVAPARAREARQAVGIACRVGCDGSATRPAQVLVLQALNSLHCVAPSHRGRENRHTRCNESRPPITPAGKALQARGRGLFVVPPLGGPDEDRL